MEIKYLLNNTYQVINTTDNTVIIEGTLDYIAQWVHSNPWLVVNYMLYGNPPHQKALTVDKGIHRWYTVFLQ